METQEGARQSEISSYEEYLLKFFPHLERIKDTLPASPQELGIQMARDALRHVREVLTERNGD
jgi:hypothetical protein